MKQVDLAQTLMRRSQCSWLDALCSAARTFFPPTPVSQKKCRSVVSRAERQQQGGHGLLLVSVLDKPQGANSIA